MLSDAEIEETCALLCPERPYIGLLCRRHYHWLDATLAEIPKLWAMLPWQSPDGAEDLAGDRIGTRVGSPAPGSLHAAALTDKRSYRSRSEREHDYVPFIPTTVAVWAVLVAEEHEPDVATKDWRPGVGESVAMLRGWRNAVAGEQWVSSMSDDVELCHRHLAAATGAGRSEPSVADCPDCGLALHNVIGMDRIRCRSCRRIWTGIELALSERAKA